MATTEIILKENKYSYRKNRMCCKLVNASGPSELEYRELYEVFEGYRDIELAKL